MIPEPKQQTCGERFFGNLACIETWKSEQWYSSYWAEHYLKEFPGYNTLDCAKSKLYCLFESIIQCYIMEGMHKETIYSEWYERVWEGELNNWTRSIFCSWPCSNNTRYIYLNYKQVYYNRKTRRDQWFRCFLNIFGVSSCEWAQMKIKDQIHDKNSELKHWNFDWAGRAAGD